MKEIFVKLCWIILFFSIYTQAQPTFNKVYPYFYFRNYTGIALSDSGYVISGIAVDSNTYKANIVTDLISFSGDLLLRFEIKRDGFDCHFWNKSIELSSDSIFFTSYEFKPGESYTKLYVLNFTDTLKTVSLNLPAPDYTISPQAMIKVDNEFYILGNFENIVLPSNSGDIFFTKISNNFEIIWSKKFGTNFLEYGYLSSLKHTVNNTILLGYNKDNRSISNHNYIFKSIIEERDTAGNLLRQYVSPNGRLQTMLSDIVPNADGSLVYACQQAWEVYVTSVSDFEMNGLIVKLDSNFNEVWNLPIRAFKNISGTALPIRNISKVTDSGGGYIASGTLYEIDTINNTGKGYGLIQKVSENGDSLWARKIVYPGQENNFINMFYDLKETPDKGFIMCGSLQPADTATNPFNNNFTYGWVVKTDSMGCVVPGCHLYDGLQENKIPTHVMKVFPNPADDMISIYYNAAKLAQNSSMLLFNQEGKLLTTLNITSNNATYMIPLMNYPSGIYYLSLYEGDTIIKTEKIIINGK